MCISLEEEMKTLPHIGSYYKKQELKKLILHKPKNKTFYGILKVHGGGQLTLTFDR